MDVEAGGAGLRERKATIVSYAYSTAGVLALVLHSGLLSLLDFSDSGFQGAVGSILTWTFLVGCLAGALGMAKQRWWGFAGLYVATLVASLGLAICMVPVVIGTFPVGSRAAALMVLNAVFLLGLVLLQVAVSRQDRIAP